MVAVPSDVVGLEIVGRFAEQEPDFCLATRARYARFRVRDQMRGIDDAGLDQRQEAKLDGGGVTAGIANDARLGNGRAMHFRQAVHRLGEQIRAGVRHLVPALEERRVLEAKIRGQVDDLHPGSDQFPRLTHGDAMGCREEDHMAGFEVGFRGIAEREVTQRPSPRRLGNIAPTLTPASVREVISADVRPAGAGLAAAAARRPYSRCRRRYRSRSWIASSPWGF